MERLQWGILGTGGIARKFAAGIAESELCRLAAIGSRSQESADRFAEDYGAEHRHASYADLLANADVQAVYIALPNHLHAEWIGRCAEAGKHILCEKPLAVNYSQAATAVESARRAGVFLMEAFMYRCHPQTARLLQLVRAGAIGEIRLIQSNFTYHLGPSYDNIRLSNGAAGGGIMDVGCYPLSLARLVAGSEPSRITGTAHIGEISRVDEVAAAAVCWKSGCVAALACGTQVNSSKETRIWGSGGSLIIPEPWHPGPFDSRIHLHKAGEDPKQIDVPCGRSVYALEADLVARCIAENRTEAPEPAPSWEDSLGNMRALDEWRRAVSLVFDVEKPDEQG